MIDPLRQFYDNQPVREAVRDFLTTLLRSRAADLTLAGKDVSGIRDAKATIDAAFAALDKTYGVRKSTRSNKAR
jgi:hypothetical protein